MMHRPDGLNEMRNIHAQTTFRLQPQQRGHHDDRLYLQGRCQCKFRVECFVARSKAGDCSEHNPAVGLVEVPKSLQGKGDKTSIKVRKADILKRVPTARDIPAQPDRATAKGRAGLKIRAANCLAGFLQAVMQNA